MDLRRIAALCAVALLAGTVDAIAGGGGLLTLPALLVSGLPPQLALGTNKGQSVFGSLAALVRYGRAEMVDRPRAAIGFPLAFLGSLAGAGLLLALRPDALRPVVLVLLGAAAVAVAIGRVSGERAALVPPRGRLLAAGAIALVLGAYDGFFGPGVGTFLILAHGLLLGAPPSRASADAKVVNFASNLAAVLLFASQGTVLWRIAAPMAVAQLCGGWLGAHLAVRRGDRLVRWAVVAVALAGVTKLAVDLFRSSG